MSVIRAQIVAEARSWLATPFHHQARVKGVGVDCAGVIIGTAARLGLCPDFIDERNYARTPDGRMRELLRRHLLPVPREQRLAGDVINFAWYGEPQHLGILTERNTVVHAYGTEVRGRVVETTRTGRHLDAVRGVYRFHEVAD